MSASLAFSSPPPLARPVRVWGLPDARAALEAAISLGAPALLLVGDAAGGALWFVRMIEEIRLECAGVDLIAVLDCADRAGDAQGALAAGVRHLLFSGAPEVAARLADIAARSGAVVLTALPPALDPRSLRNPSAGRRAWLAGGYPQ